MKLPRRRRPTGSRPAGPAARGSRGPGTAAGRRTATRPAAQLRNAGAARPRGATGEDQSHRRVPGGLTGRAAILGLVVCALVLSIGYPLKQYLAQRGEIGRLEQQRRETQQRVKALEEQKQRLSDPEYVKAQARQRLHFVLPGESLYVVVTPRQRTQPDVGGAPVATVEAGGSWYDRLWATVRAADGTPGP